MGKVYAPIDVIFQMRVNVSTPDIMIDDLIKQIEVRRAQLEIDDVASKKPRKTFGQMPWPTSAEYVNINNINANGVIILLGDMLAWRRSYAEALTLLGLSTDEIKWGDYLFDDWIEDLKTRYAQATLASQLSELNAIERKLAALISPEQKRRNEINAIADSLINQFKF